MRTGILRGLAAAAVLAAVLPAAPAQAQSLGQNVFTRLLGFGGDEEPAINYSERAPIVVPPRRDLRQPADPSVLAQDPSWPKDPDEKKRRKKRIEGAVGPASSPNELVRPLTQAELEAGRRAGPGLDTDDRPAGDIEMERKRLMNPISPVEMRKTLHLGQDETPLAPGVEPPRRSLTDPPKGLRVPVASAPLDGNEPLPSEQAAAAVPWYKRWLQSNH